MKINITESRGITTITTEFSTPKSGPISKEAVKRCIDILQSGAKASDIFNRKDYIATKLWSVEDIEDCLRSYGYDPGAENVAVISKDLNALYDCGEIEWDVVYEAIQDNKKVLKPITMKLEDMLKILQATVNYIEVDETDDVLKQMGFTEKQLVFLRAADLSEPVSGSFSDTISDNEALDLLLKIARWFYNSWKIGEQKYPEDNENLARDELDEIGFPEGIINAVWYSNDTD